MGDVQSDGPVKIMSRLEYAELMFVYNKIDFNEFMRRLELLVATDKDTDPYIVDAGPAGFIEP